MPPTFRLDADPVTEAFLEDPLVVPPATTVREVLQLLQESRRGAVLVTAPETGVLIGIFTERDALKRMARRERLDVAIERAMVQPAVAVSRQETIGDVIRTMSDGGYRRIPVVDAADRPVGVVSVAGLLHYLVEHLPRVVYNLPPTPHHRSQEKEGA